MDYSDAFMGTPLDDRELPFNCCETEHPVQLERPRLDDDEPTVGHFILWLVLGFGGHPNPLVYGEDFVFWQQNRAGVSCDQG